MQRILSNRRRYLTQDELGKLIKAARKGRYGRRDATLLLLMARHGLRVTEAVDLRWDQIDFSKGHLHVRRLKGGIHSVHPIQGISRTFDAGIIGLASAKWAPKFYSEGVSTDYYHQSIHKCQHKQTANQLRQF